MHWLVETGCRSTPVVQSAHIRDYLSYLAIQQKVSSSTQNQAFNALLFLCREVLELELNDINKAVRAKRGTRLPVVLSPEEVRSLIAVFKRQRRMLWLVYGRYAPEGGGAAAGAGY